MSVEAFDDEGVGFGPVTLAIGSNETAHLYSGDHEEGNVGKGFRLAPLAGEATGDLDRHALRAERTRMNQAMPQTRPGVNGCLRETGVRCGMDGEDRSLPARWMPRRQGRLDGFVAGLR